MSASAVGAIVNSAAYCEGRHVADVEIKDIGRVLSDPDRFIWIGLHEPDEDLLRDVQREFGLHDLAIEDAHRAHQRPKLERYGDALFVVLRTAQRDREHHRIVFGGMNFKFMPELEKPWGYPLVLAGTALICTLLYFRFKRIGWL